jgi:predicted LPLAT superfamily acyltransferase
VSEPAAAPTPAAPAPPAPAPWDRQKERGALALIMTAAWLVRLLGRSLALVLMSPVVLYFMATGAEARLGSLDYLRRAHRAGILKGGAAARRPGLASVFAHFMAFAGASVDKLLAWTGRFAPGQVDGADGADFAAAKQEGGAVVLTAHLGNPELIRAVATLNRRHRITVLSHTANAAQFNAVIRHFSGEASVNILEVREIDIAASMRISALVEAGEWIVITADRLPPDPSPQASVPAQLLGEAALFPTGPFVLAAALGCPVHFVVCVRAGRTYRLIFRRFAHHIVLPRGRRQEAIAAEAQRYAAMVEEVLRIAPLQWFNFFDYWGDRARIGAPAVSGSAEAARRDGA